MKVFKAINAVQADIAKIGISKAQENKFDNYKFRGIDDVYNALAPIIAKNGLVILPELFGQEISERQTAKGGAVFYCRISMRYHLHCIEDDSHAVVTVMGEAMDRGDKAINKAMSSAYKNFAFQTFVIPTEGDNDTENQTHEVVPTITPVRAAAAEVPAEEMEFLRAMAADIVALCEEGKIQDALKFMDAQNLDSDQKVALWGLLGPHSKVRAALKAARQA